jgi:dTDP-4-dehydrorhamnose reductase
LIRALVTGCRGQVGSELLRALDGRAEVLARDRASLDLGDADAIRRCLREERPQLIVNAGAYTAVDKAETDLAAARAVIATAPGVLAEEAKRLGALLIHFSTDYVFDGTKPGPYVETDPTNPVSAYGLSKLEGEQAIGAAGCDHLILRTSWVYGAHGKNFLLTMLRLAATHPELRVVDDQRGAPTSSRQIAGGVVELLLGSTRGRPVAEGDLRRLREAGGLYHFTASGSVTWFEFAQAIFAERATRPGQAFTAPRVIAISTREYPTPARRPANSVLSNEKLGATFGVRLADWRAGLRETLSALA